MSFFLTSPNVIDLGVNIDHVATLRNVRGTAYPDPIRAALLAEEAGADVITLHLREDPHPELFRHYVVTLTRLAHDEPPVQVLRSFERVLLREAGYALALNRTVNRKAVVAEGRYVFDPERGVREASDEWPAQWPLLSGQTLLDMEEDDYPRPQTVAQSKALMRFLLNTYLGGTPLATRQILIDLQNL